MKSDGSFYCNQDIDRKNEQTAAILKMQGNQLAEFETLYKEEQVLRKRYFNMIEGLLHVLCVLNADSDIIQFLGQSLVLLLAKTHHDLVYKIFRYER